jgi:hypothetical protein
MQGGFSFQIGSKNPFGLISVDKSIKRRSTKTPRSKKFFSPKGGAVTRYYLTYEYRSRYLRQLR